MWGRDLVGRPRIDRRKSRNRSVKSQKVVAVVDDDPIMLSAIARLLKTNGYHPKTFASSEAFLGCGNHDDIACLILDIHLGGMSGIELGYRLKATGSRVPIVFITANNDEASRQRATDIGCVAYLRKPIGRGLLIRAVGKATG